MVCTLSVYEQNNLRIAVRFYSDEQRRFTSLSIICFVQFVLLYSKLNSFGLGY